MERSPRFVDSGSYPARPGNHVRPLVDGLPAFQRICESIEAARRSVWATITFMWAAFEMPGDRGTPLCVFEHAARSGIDVRLIFWRPEDHQDSHRRNAFWGSPAHLELLASRYPHVNVRWDRAAPGYCQHQKTWLIDAGEDWATSFVGGINLNPNSLVPPGHDHRHSGAELQNHDVYVELTGPAVADVHHNFVQRWNEASERDSVDGCFGDSAREALPFPGRLPGECGSALVQIQRTTHRALYRQGHPPVDGRAFDISLGERTNLEQYRAAIGAAARTIYVENQYLEDASIVTALHDALRRGIEVLLVLPVTPDYSLRSIDLTDRRRAFLALRSALSSHDNFMLCGLAAEDAAGQRTAVYVHSKLMVVDGRFASVGSCNLHHYSLAGNGELNAAIQDPQTASAILSALFQEHLGEDTSRLDDLGAIRRFKQVARRNRQLREQGDPRWQGLAFCMDMATYGNSDQLGPPRD